MYVYILKYVLRTGLPYDDPWLTMLCILMFCLFIATFVSHTVASLILMPIISRIGMDLGIPKTVVVGSAFASTYKVSAHV
jgi:di/tricarboxylate transporter